MTGRKTRSAHAGGGISVLTVIIALLILAVSMLLLLLEGAGVYGDVSEQLTEYADTEACVRYIMTKVRHFDDADSVGTKMLTDPESGEKTRALVLTEREGDESYDTLIYYYDGGICEFTCESGDSDDPAWGSRILPAEFLDIIEKDGVIKFIFTDENGRQATGTVSCRAGREVAG